jgi:hypothetical protein
LSLNTYIFYDTTNTIVKRKNNKRKIVHHDETTHEVVQLWNVSHLNEEEFVEEVVDDLGEFVDLNKCPVRRLHTQLKKKNKKALELQEQLSSQETI